MNNPIIMHINFMEQGQTMDEICAKASKIGYDGIEFRRIRDGVNETQEEYIKEIAEGVKKYNIKYVYFGRPGVNSACLDDKIIQKETDDFKRFVDIAYKNLKIDVFNYMAGVISKPNTDYFNVDKHGSAYATPKQYEKTVEVCRQLGNFLRDYDCRIAFETHMHFIHDTIDSTMKLVNDIDLLNVGVNLDYGNMVYFNSQNDLMPEKAIDKIGDKLFYLHLKNSVGFMGKRFETALAEGDINHRAYLKHLISTNYNGCIGIEAPRGGDREYFAECDYNYVKQLFCELNGEGRYA